MTLPYNGLLTERQTEIYNSCTGFLLLHRMARVMKL